MKTAIARIFTTLLLTKWVAASIMVDDDAKAMKRQDKNLRLPRKDLSIIKTPAEDRKLGFFKTPESAPKIVGGDDAAVGDYPFFVHGDGCGASLIWKDVILTAGKKTNPRKDSFACLVTVSFSLTCLPVS